MDEIISWSAAVDGLPTVPPWSSVTPEYWVDEGDYIRCAGYYTSLQVNTGSGFLTECEATFRCLPDHSSSLQSGHFILLVGESLNYGLARVGVLEIEIDRTRRVRVWGGIGLDKILLLDETISGTSPIEIVAHLSYDASLGSVSWEVSGAVSGSGAMLATEELIGDTSVPIGFAGGLSIAREGFRLYDYELVGTRGTPTPLIPNWTTFSWDASVDGVPSAEGGALADPSQWTLMGDFARASTLTGTPMIDLSRRQDEEWAKSFEIEVKTDPSGFQSSSHSTGLVGYVGEILGPNEDVVGGVTVMLTSDGTLTIGSAVTWGEELGVASVPPGPTSIKLSLEYLGGGSIAWSVEGDFGTLSGTDETTTVDASTIRGTVSRITVSNGGDLYSINAAIDGGVGGGELIWSALRDGVPAVPPFTDADPNAWTLYGDYATPSAAGSLSWWGEGYEEVSITLDLEVVGYGLWTVISIPGTIESGEVIDAYSILFASDDNNFQVLGSVDGATLEDIGGGLHPLPGGRFDLTMALDNQGSWSVTLPGFDLGGHVSAQEAEPGTLDPGGGTWAALIWGANDINLYSVTNNLGGGSGPWYATAFMSLDTALTLDSIAIFDRALNATEAGRLSGN